MDVASSSDLERGGGRPPRPGRVFDGLAGPIIQYLENDIVGDARIEWAIPRADGVQRGILRSASVGTYGDSLTFRTPVYGDISVAFLPGLEGYSEEKLPPDFGFQITARFVRLA